MAGLGQVVAIKCDICEDKNGTLFCYECSHYLCQPCELFHRKIPSTKHHHVTDSYKVDKLEAKNNFPCEDHKREYALFCTSCEALICALCVTTNHGDHSYKALSDAVSEARKSLKGNVVHLKEKIGSVNSFMEKVKTTELKQIIAERELFTTEVSQTSNVLNEIIESISTICITKTTDHFQLEHSRLSDVLVTLQGMSCEYTSLCDKFERALTVEQDISVISNQLILKKELTNTDIIPTIEEPKMIEKFSKERFIKSVVDKVLKSFNIKIFPKQEELDDLKEKLEKEKSKIASIQRRHEEELTKLRDDTLKQVAIERTKFENERQDKAKVIRTEQENKARFETKIAKLQETLSQKAAEIVTLEEKIRLHVSVNKERKEHLDDLFKENEKDSHHFRVASTTSVVKETKESLKAVKECATCEVRPEFIEHAKSLLSDRIFHDDLTVEDHNGKLFLKGSLENVQKASKMLQMMNDKEDGNRKHDSAEKTISEYVSKRMPMSEDEYTGLLHFSKSETWFSMVEEHGFKDGGMTYKTLKTHNSEIQSCLKAKIDSMRLIGNAEIVIDREVSDNDLKTVQYELERDHNASCFFSLDKKRIKIKAENYEKAQQVKYIVELKLGLKKTSKTRKKRKFGSNKNEFKNEESKTKDHKSYSGGSLIVNRSFSKHELTLPSNCKKIKTTEGLNVLVYEDNILKLKVDCIVNAANSDLQHGGGIAFYIAQEAGDELERESMNHIKMFGPLQVGTSCFTTAGNMRHYRCVIHTVGPNWHDYSGQDGRYRCLRHLKEAVISAMIEASKLELTSVAIPAISSGIFAVPKELCAQEYVRAVEEFSKKFRNSSLKEIHFVDKDARIVELTADEFLKFYGGMKSEFPSGNTFGPNFPETKVLKTEIQEQDKWAVQGSFTKSTNISIKHRILSNQFVFNVADKIEVKLVKGDITDCKTNVIVCPQEEQLQCFGRIAKAIHEKAAEVYKDSNAQNLKHMRIKIGAVYPLKTSVSMQWNYVFHVVPPRWGLSATKNPNEFETNLEKTVFNLLDKTEEFTRTDSIAIPLMGVSTDENKYPTPLPTCIRAMVKGIKKFAEQRTKNIKVEIWGFDESVLSIMRETCSDILTPSPSTGPNYSKDHSQSTHNRYGGRDEPKYDESNIKPENFGKTLKGYSGDGEKCCICMDSLTNPKRLRCGHIFCKECIELAFTHKQVCPSCGMVYGKLTGNQSVGGRMTKYEVKYQDLPGYKDCGHIRISYYIPGGKQTEEHPNPGKYYDSITRPAYLPNNEKGKLVASLLEIAFNQRLIFTIGESRTSGHEGVVTWNDIHHKTRMDGGPTKFGYPDPTYLDRVLEELAAKGITKESLLN